MANPSVQIDAVARLETSLVDARKRAAAALRETREAKGLSLRQVSQHVALSPAALSLLENGKTWQTSTARRVLAFYREVAVEAVAAA